MNKLCNTFGMYEMELAAQRIIDIAKTEDRSTSINDMENNDERIGYVELVANGWLRAGDYNGEFFPKDSFWARVNKKKVNRFTVNAHCVKNDNDIVGINHPLNTYVTNDIENVVTTVRNILRNSLSGINRIVVLDNTEIRLKEANAGQSPMNIDEKGVS